MGTEKKLLEKIRKMFDKDKPTVTELVQSAKELSTFTEAEERAVMAKRRPLKLTFTNLSKSTRINYHQDMFKTGKFFNHPVNTINHGEKMTILVMNTEGLHLAGVSGGLTLELKSEHRQTEYSVCTFSNPLVGCVKASIFLSSEGGQDQIHALWEPMMDCAIVKETFYGIYRESDKHIHFVWKDSKTQW